ncbi:Crp/Fnr family transcriptional regulator [Listeria sp. FSL L7-1582]|uniref:Crp/Fnr family transcriptional regulator n=1 Tax=Listeria portnoyi TaxID=2713504 RepID=UPI00164DCA8E|nr:Crp/Fnr family transcriptional regulator [Listeria portnoyi]MBC6310716.1 Crp/Fnr family transcriptional regulator [Listeria portnoyi]
MSCLRDIDLDEHLHMLLQPGDFSSLPSDSEEIPEITECRALTEVTYWEIDTAFFKKMMSREDPDGEIFTKHVIKSRKNIEEHFLMDRMHPEDRIYFSLLMMMPLSSPLSTNVTQLPSFVSNETIAEFAITPVNYTLNVLQQLQEEQMLSIGVDHWLIIDVAAFHTILQAKNIL